MSTDVFRINSKCSQKSNGLNPITFISISGYTYACALYITKQDREDLKRENLYLLVEKHITGCVSGVFGGH